MPFSGVRNTRVYYRWQPAEAATTPSCFLLIHGLGSSHAYYAPIIPDLLAKGYSCLSVDTPGSGLSDNASRNDTKEMAEVLVELVLQLGIEPSRLIIVGHSMGAIIASDMSRRQAVKGVVLIGPVNPNPALREPFTARVSKVEKEGLEALADTIPTAATGSKSTATHHAFIRTLILSQRPEGYISLCKTIVDAKARGYDDLTAPLLIIAGSDDKTSPIEGCQTILKSWGVGSEKKQIQVLEGVGHWQVIEAPEEVARLLVGFAKNVQ